VLVDNVARAASDGSRILVSGVEDETQTPATLLINQDILLGNADGAGSVLTVSAGGIVDIGRTLSIGHQPDAYPIVFVAGAGSTLTAGQTAGASCTVGFGGGGELNVSAGGDFHCQRTLFVGLGDEDAYLTITGATSRVRAQRLEIGAPASADPAADGILELKGGQLILDQPSTIWENGTLSGNGQIEGDLNVVGTLEPDLIGLDPAPNQIPMQDAKGKVQHAAHTIPMRLGMPAAGIAQAGALRVAGTLTFAPGSRLEVRLTGPGQYGQLEVTGAATLGGSLVLNFSEGYAPEAGDVFQFVRAEVSVGAFDAVQVTGLAPGWQYTLATDDGIISLTARTDGVATTRPTQRIYLPVVRR
jgi:T5SS/PEP-CTERM-associated repeat protein